MSGMDPVEFWTARLDEDEQAARALAEVLTQLEDLRRVISHDIRNGAGYVFQEGKLRPARVLADIEAKRAILDEHERQEPVRPLIGPQCCRCVKEMHGWQEDWSAQEYPCRTVRLLMSVYADHPDYCEEWAP